MLNKSDDTEMIMQATFMLAKQRHLEFVTPELTLASLTTLEEVEHLFHVLNQDLKAFRKELLGYIDTLEKVPEGVDYQITPSQQFGVMLGVAVQLANSTGAHELDIYHLLLGMIELPDSMASYLLHKYSGNDTEILMSAIALTFGLDGSLKPENPKTEEEEEPEQSQIPPEYQDTYDDEWKQYVTCINDKLKEHNQLIGREKELDRTIQILCRKQKNNPVHIGEPGVGKTSLVYGLAQRIENGDVPKRLKDCKIYQINLGSLVAGSQFRGDIEQRLQSVMDGVKRDKATAIVYIDEIHNIIGTGASAESNLDIGDILIPHIDEGIIRFIGSTSFKEYSKHFEKNSGLVRRFQTVEVNEPSIDETVKILDGLIENYESFHHVKYNKGVTRYAAEKSAKYITGKFLPDKAIDLIDEAGAYRELHPLINPKTSKPKRPQTVDNALIADVLSKICKIDNIAEKEDEQTILKSLSPRILSQIYGQDEAVKAIVQAVQMSKVGLLDDTKPIASLLFVGPTGVGKTELAKVLAKELGISFIRFDMSEYTEKHTVAKLIGSPAGYVGYDEGGLLTDAIRQTPNCVLLLDEIEKAHSDIYNILLQVMDYASLTDNKGKKADFRHVIIIMTSNAGAQYASQANVGFNGGSTGNAMLSQVKKTFKPEFINRLTATVVFNDLDRNMAKLIFDKKIMELQQRLEARKIKLQLSPEAENLLLDKGFSKTYGARELERTINSMLNPLLMNEILFGKLNKGGNAQVKVSEDKKLTVSVK